MSGGYCRDEGNGERGLFLAKVLIGDTVSGVDQNGKNKPPMKPDGITMYDSVTDNTRMYVVYSNEKSYPAYYVKFKV